MRGTHLHGHPQRASPSRHRVLLLVVITLSLSSVVLSTSPGAAAQGSAWLQTTREDFENGTARNLDLGSQPGSVMLAPSVRTWVKSQFNPGLRQSPIGQWDDSGLASPVVLREEGIYKMWYAGDDSGLGSYRIGYAVSSDGVNWSKPRLGYLDYGGSTNNNLVLGLGIPGLPDDAAVVPGAVLRDAVKYRMWYSCMGLKWGICLATSGDGRSWVRSPLNPVVSSPVSLVGVLSPAVYHDGTKFHMWFAGLNGEGRYHLRYATSFDGTFWSDVALTGAEDLGEAGSWNDGGMLPAVIQSLKGTWRMWHSGVHNGVQSIGFSESKDALTWSADPASPILAPGPFGFWDSDSLSRPWVIDNGHRGRMWYAGFDGSRWGIGTAVPAYGERVPPPSGNPVLPLGDLESWESGGMFRPTVLLKDGTYHMWYTGSATANGSTGFSIGYATSTDGVRWTKSLQNPVLAKNATGWDSAWVGFAWVMWENSSKAFRMWYTGSDGTSVRIGLAESSDGVQWVRNAANPILIVDLPTWFNPDDVRCPWVTIDGDHHTMLVPTRLGDVVQIAEARSWDEGLTWSAARQWPVLSPMPGTWEGSSVSCPVVVRGSITGRHDLWYEGSTSATVASFGGIGLASREYFDENFTRSPSNPVLSGTKPWDAAGVGGPGVALTGGGFRIWFHGSDLDYARIGMALSEDSIHWHDSFVSPTILGSGSWSSDPVGVSSPMVFRDDNVWYLYHAARMGGEWMIRHTDSDDGRNWKGVYGVEIAGASPGDWDVAGRKPLSVTKVGSVYHLWYSGLDLAGRWSIGHATSLSPWQWTADPNNPVLRAGAAASWDCEGVEGASVLYPGLTYPFEMWFSGHNGATWRIGFAHSNDGSVWTKAGANPVLYPSAGLSWDSVAVAAPRVVVEGGVYHAFFSGYDGSVWSLGHAFSYNGITWVKSEVNPILGGSRFASKAIVDIRDSWTEPTATGYRVWFSDSSQDNSAIAYAEAAYLSVGTLESSAVDSGDTAPTWVSVVVSKSTPPFSAASVSVRSGVPPLPNVKWGRDFFSSSFSPQAGRGRFLQYRLTMISIRGDTTPAIDEVGGEYLPDSYPDAQVVRPSPDSCIRDSQPIMQWSYSDPEGDFQGGFYLQVSDAENFTQATYSFSMGSDITGWRVTDSLPDGRWFWRIWVWDSYKVPGPWTEPSEFYIDTKPPRTSLNVSGPEVGFAPRYVSAGTVFSFNVSDVGCGAGATVFRLDSSSWQRFTSPFSITVPGHHLLEYYSIDAAGNVEAGRSDDLWVDVTPPTTSTLVGTPSVTEGNVIYLTPTTPVLLTASDAESGICTIEYSLDVEDNWTAVAGPLVFTDLPGQHVLYYRSTDLVGNAEGVQSQEIYVDGVAPRTHLQVTGPYVQGSPLLITPSAEFSLSATDDGAGVKDIFYTLDGGPPYVYVGEFTIAAEGFHTFTYYAKDRLDNVAQPNIVQVFVDGSGPATTLLALGPSYTTLAEIFLRASTALALSSIDGGCGLRAASYSIDGGQWDQYSSPFNISSPGPHTLSFFGEDVLGNREPPKLVQVFVDEEPPETSSSIVGLSAEYGGSRYIGNQTSIVLNASDIGSGVLMTKYRIDMGTWVVYGGPFVLVTHGMHQIEIQSTDRLGMSEQTHMIELTVDSSWPVAAAGPDVAMFAPARVALDASSSTDDTLIVGYHWVAEWNHSVVLEGVSGTISLDAPGDYVVRLKVVDILGREATDTIRIKLLVDPDSDKDFLPDVWEREKFGNLTYGPGDDPDGDGVTNEQEYRGQENQGNQGGSHGGVGGTVVPKTEQQFDGMVLILLALMGILAGVAVLQGLKIKELRKKLENVEAEESILQDELEDRKGK